MVNQITSMHMSNAIMSIVIGIALVLLTIVGYLAIWLPRVEKKYWVNQKSSWFAVFGSIPWILLFTYFLIVVITIATITYYSFYPPNW